MALSINAQITQTESAIQKLEKELANLKAEQKKQTYINPYFAYRNAYEALFDGIKYVADPENPIPLKFPMFVKANMYYTQTVNDGIKDVVTRYVCVKEGMVNEINEEYFEEF